VAGQASGALAWSLLNTAVSRVGTLGIGIVLARVLGPKEFGTYAVAYIVMIAVMSFNELGVSLAIVRWPSDPKEIAPTVTTISLVSSAVLAGMVFLVAPPFADAMGDPRAVNVIRLLGFSVIVSGAVASPAALLQRQFRQDLRMLIDQVNVWVGAITSVVLALLGSGAMSLAVGRVAGAATSGLLFILYSPEPFRLGFDRSKVGPLLHFGLPLAAASIGVFAVGSIDQFIVGKTLGATALGFYVLAFNLSSWPVTMFSLPLRNVAPAVFSRLQHQPDNMRAALRAIIGVLTAIAVPSCLALSGAAEPIIRLVYGHVWLPAAGVLTWLAILAALRIFFELTYDYLVVIGVSRAILVLQLSWLAALTPALLLGARSFGIAGAAAAQVIVAALVVLPLYLYQFRRVGVPVGLVLRRIGMPVLIGLGVGAGALALSRSGLPDVGSILLSGVLILAGVGGLLYRDRSTLTALRDAARTRTAESEVSA
jgi:PST family polysaccharide transporter